MRSWGETVADLKNDAAANMKAASWRGVLTGFFLSPGIYALVHFRLAQFAFPRGRLGKLIAKLLWMRLSHETGCHMSPLATVAGGLQLPHPTGIVLGERSIIEGGVTIFQNVTVGQRNGGYPTIAEGATINAGAVLAGSIRVGKGAVIGALTFVNKDVADGDVVAGSPARSLRT